MIRLLLLVSRVSEIVRRANATSQGILREIERGRRRRRPRGEEDEGGKCRQVDCRRSSAAVSSPRAPSYRDRSGTGLESLSLHLISRFYRVFLASDVEIFVLSCLAL